MTVRTEVKRRVIIKNKPVTIQLINNPLIDDVVVTEAKVYLYGLESGTVDTSRRVERGLRDFFIKIGVEK